MWYSGQNVNQYIGYATSNDGIAWTKHPGNPVMDLGPSGAWDDAHLETPSVLRDNQGYQMWYTGFGTIRRIGYARSPDGITWTKFVGNPVLDVGASGEWDEVRVAHPSVLFDDGVYKMWYYGGQPQRIGYATSTPHEVSKEITGVDRIEATPIFDVFVGDMFTYTIEIENPFEQAVYFMVSDILDMALKYVQNSFRVNRSLAGNEAFDTGDLSYTDHLLGAGSFLSLSFKVEVLDVPVGYLIDNTAWVTAYTNPQNISGTTLAMVDASAPQAHVIPEPTTLLLFGTGLIGILALVRRTLKKRK
jgi:uncharacterized repeat protein (TIGR01451 family)